MLLAGHNRVDEVLRDDITLIDAARVAQRERRRLDRCIYRPPQIDDRKAPFQRLRRSIGGQMITNPARSRNEDLV